MGRGEVSYQGRCKGNGRGVLSLNLGLFLERSTRKVRGSPAFPQTRATFGRMGGILGESELPGNGVGQVTTICRQLRRDSAFEIFEMST